MLSGWMHAWSLRRRRAMGRFWARGNGWALHAIVEKMAVDPARSKPVLSNLLVKTCEGLLALQSPCGSWHTVLDEPCTYVETSGQALIVRGMARAARLGLVPGGLRSKLRAAACRGWTTVANHVSDEGAVTGTSLGTTAGSLREYARRPTASWPVWGPASVILAACEIAQIP
jgi:unsaturated rhamnogalacturonyl hydrolase